MIFEEIMFHMNNKVVKNQVKYKFCYKIAKEKKVLSKLTNGASSRKEMAIGTPKL